jgi:hypothetical protein
VVEKQERAGEFSPALEDIRFVQRVAKTLV